MASDDDRALEGAAHRRDQSTAHRGHPVSAADASFTDRYKTDPQLDTIENMANRLLMLARDVDSGNRRIEIVEAAMIQQVTVTSSIDKNLALLVQLGQADAERRSRLELAQLEAATKRIEAEAAAATKREEAKLAAATKRDEITARRDEVRGSTRVKVWKVIGSVVLGLITAIAGILAGRATK